MAEDGREKIQEVELEICLEDCCNDFATVIYLPGKMTGPDTEVAWLVLWDGYHYRTR
jgi:hypothetical protein